MNKDPLVSVIMATYNEPQKFIKESISSILNQTYRNLELLIADDSTNEETIRVIDDFASEDNRVILIRKEKRMGFVNALNEALSLAKGDFIARMDGDDIAFLDRFEKQVFYAREHPDIDIFGGDIEIVDENNKVISERTFPTKKHSIKLFFIFRSPLSHPTIMFKRSIIDDGYRYNPAFKKDEDLDLFLRLYKNGFTIRNMGERLIKYRIVGDITQKRDRSQFVYNHRARSQNFDIHRPFFSCLSWGVSLMYLCIPMSIFSYVYKKENSRF